MEEEKKSFSTDSLGTMFAVVFGVIGFVGVMIFVASIIGGFVISYMWNSLFVPIFNVNPLTIPQAIAVSMFLSYFIPSDYAKEKAESKAKLIGFVARLGFILLMTWILHFYV